VTVRACRIVMAEHVPTAFTGEGAALYGGRWNSKGVRVVYIAGSQALAVLESLVHLELRDLEQEFALIEVSFEGTLVETLDADEVPRDWQSDIPPESLAQLGDEWIASQRSAVLRVPSVIIDDEWNYLLNPSHPRFARINIGQPRPFRFDPRLSK